MKKITDIRIGDPIWVRELVVRDLSRIFVKMMLLSLDKESGQIVVRSRDSDSQLQLPLAAYNDLWFINDPEFWDARH